MDIEALRTFFMWCTILNVGLLIFSALVFTLGREWVYRVHGALYPMPRETFNVAIYTFLGFFKIIVIVFNFVPWLALTIIS